MDGLVRQVVAYVDTDAGGIMYHARYIDLAERSRLQWVLDRGMSFDTVAREHDTLLVIHKLASTYHAPARLENVLFARTELIKMSPVRGCWRTIISLANKVLVTVTVDVVAISAHRKELARFPASLIDAFSRRPSGAVLPAPIYNALHD